MRRLKELFNERTISMFEGTPLEEGMAEFGCTVVFHDIDNEFRPEEETQITTSVFSPLDPTTYGSMVLIQPDKWYGETINIYKDEIMKYLIEYGF